MATDADDAPLLAEEPLRPGSCSRELELREFRDRYVFRSLDGGGAFAVARADGSLRPLSPEEAASGSDYKVSRIYGVAGMIRMLAGSYVLVITSRKDAGSYQASTVYRVNSMKFLCCNEAIKHLTSEEKRDEAYFMSLLRIAETTCGLYYSYDRDLTLNLQRASKLSAGRVHKPLWKQADPRFVWNRNLLEELIETKLDEFITPLIQGRGHGFSFHCASAQCYSHNYWRLAKPGRGFTLFPEEIQTVDLPPAVQFGEQLNSRSSPEQDMEGQPRHDQMGQRMMTRSAARQKGKEIEAQSVSPRRRSDRIRQKHDGVRIDSIQRASHRKATSSGDSNASAASAGSTSSRRRRMKTLPDINKLAPMPVTECPQEMTVERLEELAECCGITTQGMLPGANLLKDTEYGASLGRTPPHG